MHEAAFSQAALPAPARVLGLSLRPFSLGHELWLTREQNPFALSASPAGMGALLIALPEAVLLCSQRFAEIAAMNHDRWLGLKLWLWRRRLQRLNLGTELAAFLEYRTRGSLGFPDEPPESNERGRQLGAPLLLTLHAFAMSLGNSESAAWDYPYGLAQMRYAAAAELEGRLRIKNKFEVAHDEGFAEWEKEHPGSTLKMESKENSLDA